MKIMVEYSGLQEMLEFCQDVRALLDRTAAAAAPTKVIAPAEPPATEPSSEKKGRAKKEKPVEAPAAIAPDAQQPPENPPTAVTEPAPSPAPAADPTAEKVVTIDDLRALVQGKVKEVQGATEKLKDCLSRFGASSLSQNNALLPENYAAFAELVEKEVK